MSENVFIVLQNISVGENRETNDEFISHTLENRQFKFTVNIFRINITNSY
jgi:hypothetical protein